MTLQKKAKLIFLLTSAATLILGVCLIVWPAISARTICYLIGALTLIVGIVKIVCYMRSGSFGLPLYSELATGILDGIVGIILLLHPADVLTLLPLFIGAFVIVDSIFMLQTAFDLRRAGLSAWWSVLLLSLLSMIFGVLLMVNPFTGGNVLTVMIGITLIVSAVQNIVTVLYAAKYLKDHIVKETIYHIQ